MINPRPTLPTPFGTAYPTPALRPLTRRRGILVPVLVVLFFVLAAAAVLVHLVVVPLPVAAVWLRPAMLLVDSQPQGADIVLDGRKLPAPTPMRVQVRRDLAVHVVELRRDDFLTVSRPIRYDKEIDLALTVALEPAPRPATAPKK
jgi:hypothetical protein